MSQNIFQMRGPEPGAAPSFVSLDVHGDGDIVLMVRSEPWQSHSGHGRAGDTAEISLRPEHAARLAEAILRHLMMRGLVKVGGYTFTAPEPVVGPLGVVVTPGAGGIEAFAEAARLSGGAPHYTLAEPASQDTIVTNLRCPVHGSYPGRRGEQSCPHCTTDLVRAY